MLVLSRLTLAGVRTAVATDGGAAIAADLASLVQSPNDTFVPGCVGERRKKIQLLGFLDPWNHCPSKMTHNIQWDEVKTKNKTKEITIEKIENHCDGESDKKKAPLSSPLINSIKNLNIP